MVSFLVEDVAGARRGRVCAQFQDERLIDSSTSIESWCGSVL